MKIKTKKMLTLAMSAVLILSSLPTNVFSAHSESQKLNQAMNSDVKVSGSIGSLISDELQSGQKENSNEIEDYVVYDVDYDPDTSMINVSYGAKSDCTLFVGFYNDDCTELIYSKTVDLEENYVGDVETAIPRKLPGYYLIKCFIVDDMKRPLCKAKTNDRYTKAVQDIMGKEYNDKEFNQNNVVFFEENDKSNFFVAKKELHSITSTDDADHYIENTKAEENGEYSFEKIDKIADLKKGDEVVVYTDSQSLLFIIKSIKINGDKATIKSEDCELEDLCSFIKLDSSTLPSAKEAEFEIADEFKEQVDCEIVEDPEESTSDKEKDIQKKSENPFEVTLDSPTALAKEYADSFVNRITIGLKDLKNKEYNFDDDKFKVSITGQITLDTTCDFNIYLSQDYKSVNLNLTNIFYLELEGKLEVDVPIAWIPLVNGPFVFISLNINLNVLFSGKLFCSISSELTAQIPSKDTNGKVIDYTPPKLKIDGAYGLIQIAFKFDLSIGVVSKKVLSFHLKPEAGVEVLIDEVEAAEANGVFSEAELQFSKNNQADPDTHPCIICFPGKVQLFVDIEAEGIAFGHDVSANLFRHYFPLGECYCSAVLGFGWGECPNKGRSKSLSPVDKVVNPFALKAVDPTDTDTATGAVGERGYVNKSKYPDLKYDIHGDGSVYIDGEGEFSTFTPTEERNKGTLTKIIFTDPNTIVKGIPHNQPIETVDLRQTKMANAYITFMSHDNLKNVYFPDTLESMDYYTFAECHNLEKIDLPPNLTNIGRFVFQNCTSLKEIELPSKVKNIGLYAFYGCKNLATFKTNDALETIGESAFAHSGITSIVIPESIKKIDGSAFSGSWGSSENLKSVTINGDYEGELTFSGLKSLESVKFGDKVTKINEMAFHGCSNITELEIPENIKTIEYAAFGGLDNLKSVTINGDYEGTSTFSGLKSLESVKFGNKVTKINKKDFYGCTNIAEIEIPENITTIGNSAFYNTGLKKVVIPESITQIDDAAFSACKSLTDIYILNPTAKFNSNIISGYSNIRIHGYKGSTAEKLGETGKNANIFIPFENDDPTNIEGIHTSTGHSDDTSTTPKMEYEYAGGEPDKEYIFMIVPESDTEEPDIDNAIYIDQKTSDADGNVTFTFNKPADENVSYIIIGETNSKENDDIQQEPIDNSEENITPEKTTTLYGDSNGDGKVDMSDAVLIMQMMANPNKFQVSPEFKENADVYQTGTGITTMDALSIQKYLLGLIPSLPEK